MGDRALRGPLIVGMLVGFNVEGWDFLILRALLERLLDLPQGGIEVDWIDLPGRGWHFVLENLPTALRRFYSQCAQLAVVGIDNDGNHDLIHTGQQEDPNRPRHWNHSAPRSDCRYCEVLDLVEKTRSELTYVPMKPGATWPILVAVPVETIEAWLLELQAILASGKGAAPLRAENALRTRFKQELYGRPEATLDDVKDVALPLVQAATAAHLTTLCARSRSFADFVRQVDAHRMRILGPRDCWAAGDGAAERTPAPVEGAQ